MGAELWELLKDDLKEESSCDLLTWNTTWRP